MVQYFRQALNGNDILNVTWLQCKSTHAHCECPRGNHSLKVFGCIQVMKTCFKNGWCNLNFEEKIMTTWLRFSFILAKGIEGSNIFATTSSSWLHLI